MDSNLPEPATISTGELRALLLANLGGTARRDDFRWSILIGPIELRPAATHPDGNWTVRATGSGAEVALIDRAVAQVRLDHPLARR